MSESAVSVYERIVLYAEYRIAKLEETYEGLKKEVMLLRRDLDFRISLLEEKVRELEKVPIKEI